MRDNSVPGHTMRMASQADFHLDRAADFIHALGSVGSRRRLVLEVVKRPTDTVGAIASIVRLPRLTVSLSDGLNGQSLRNRFSRRLLGVRVACLGQAVLVLPDSLPSYMSGRSRRAVRNNVSRAKDLGLTARAITDAREGDRLAQEVDARRPPRTEWIVLGTDRVRPPELEWFGVFGPDNAVLGVAAVCVDVAWAHLQFLTCVTDDERASVGRYLLHTHVVSHLLERGVRYINSDSGMRVSAGVRYLQQILGYQVVNLRVSRARLPTDGAPQSAALSLGQSVPAALGRALRNHGYLRTVTRIPHYLGELGFDFRYHVKTAGVVEVGGRRALDGAAGYYAYAPMDLQAFPRALHTFGVPTEPTFVDFGCGKGRVLILAAKYGFRRVVGVERISAFCEDANRNLATFAARTSHHVAARVLCIDAAEYAVSSADGVFFFYNPFPAEVLRKVIQNIRESVLAHPRPIWLIYAYPMHSDEIDRDEFWVKTDETSHRQFGSIALYRPRRQA